MNIGNQGNGRGQVTVGVSDGDEIFNRGSFIPVTADDDFRVSDSESSEEEGKGIYAYHGECSFSSADVESFQEVALSRRPEL